MKAFAKNGSQNGTPTATKHDKGSDSFFGVQAKLSIGKPNDKYEKEADSIADQVVAKSGKNDSFFGGGTFFPSANQPVVQKSPFEEVQKQEDSEEIQEKPLAETITPVVQLSDDDDEPVQEKCAACAAKEEKLQRSPFEEIQQKSAATVKERPETTSVQTKCATCEKEAAEKNESSSLQRKGGVEFPALPEGVTEAKEEEVGMEGAVEAPATEEIPAEEAGGEGKAAAPATDLPNPSKEEKKEIEMPVQTKGGTAPNSANIESSLQSSKGGGNSMSSETQQEMGSGFGANFSNVKIHTDSKAVQMNQDLGAQAFTHGSDIYFNQGKYDPKSTSGKHLLAHELTHTVQQGASGDSIQRLVMPEKKASPEGNPEKPNDGAAVEGKSNNKINNDDRVSDGDDLSEEEKKEKKSPPRGEVRSEKSSVHSEGVATPPVDRGSEAVDKIAGQKAEMEAQLSEEGPAAEAETEGEQQAENTNLGEADAAAQRSQQALATANAVPIPERPQAFKHPTIATPVDSAGQDLPRQGKIDTQVRGLGYIGEMLREKGYEMKKHAAEKEIHSYGLDGSLETSRQDLALAKEGTQMTEDQNTERKDISEKSKKALDESKQRQQFVAKEAPALAAEAKEGESDSSALASDSNSKASQSKSEIPDDPDAKADAEQQSAEMEQTSKGASSMDDAITQTGARATQYIADAEQASTDNQQSETQITENDGIIAQLDGKVGEMKGLNEASQGSIDASAAGPDLIRQHSQKTAASGDQLIRATIVMETELNALQDEYFAGMAAIESKETAEERLKKEQEEQQNKEASPEELQLFSLAALPEEEQQAQIDSMAPEEKQGLMAALDKMIAQTPDDGTTETEGARMEVKLSSGEGGPTDPRQDQIGAVDQQRTTRLGGVLDIADQNMNFLSAEQQRMLAEKLVAESITDDIKNISVQQMAQGMLEGMVNPMAALQGVVGGFEKTFSGVANIFNADAWAKDPLGNLLQIAADISTGLAMVFSSILGIAGMITALMVALTIISWGTLSPITGPVIGWMGTVMTYAGWGAIVAGLLAVYFNSLAYIKNLNDAGTAETARELFGNTEQMKQNASDGFAGAMAVVEGVGAVKMGPVMKSGAFMKNVPKSPGAFARQTINGAKEGLESVAKLPSRAAAGAKKLFSGGKKGLVGFKKKVQGFFSKSNKAPDLDVDVPRNVRNTTPDGGDLGSFQGRKVNAEVDLPDGHKARVLDDGQCAICSSCQRIRGKYGPDLEARPDLDAKLKGFEDRLKKNPNDADAIAGQRKIHDELGDAQVRRVSEKVDAMEKRIADGDRTITREEFAQHNRDKRTMDQGVDAQVERTQSKVDEMEQRIKDGDRDITREEFEQYHKDRRTLDQGIEKQRLRQDPGNANQRRFEESIKAQDGLSAKEMRQLREYNDSVPNSTRSVEDVLADIRQGKVFNPETNRFGRPKGEAPQGNPALRDRATQRPETRRNIRQKQIDAGHYTEIDGVIHLTDPNTGKVLPNYPDNYPDFYPDGHKLEGQPHPKAGQAHPKAGEPRGDIGHKPGHEWRNYQQDTANATKTRQQVIEDQNVADNFFFEDPSSNRSHKFEAE